MGFFTKIKASRAMALHNKGDIEGARKLYEEAIAEGLNLPRPLLAYALILIRAGEYEKAKALLIKTQKAEGITPEQKSQLFMDYAVCCHKLGETEKGVSLLEKQHRRTPTGMTYQTLGYLYVEQFSPEHKEAFLAYKPASAEDEDVPAPAEDREQLWEDGKQKTLAFNLEALEYDDEDSVVLDNLGQTYYRVLGDKATAKGYFEKAYEIKPGQIDTLWHLSRYDLEAGNKAAAIEKLEKALEGRFSPLNFATKAMVEAEIKRIKG